MTEVMYDRAAARRWRRFTPQQKQLASKTSWRSLAIGGLGMLWPLSIVLFANIRGSLTHAYTGSSGKYRYMNVSDFWPDFTAPWPIPVALICICIGFVIWAARNRAVFRYALRDLAWSWLGVGGGITATALIFVGSSTWPVWELWLGVPVLAIGGGLYVFGRRVLRDDVVPTDVRRDS
jgi:hypothetical protein